MTSTSRSWRLLLCHWLLNVCLPCYTVVRSCCWTSPWTSCATRSPTWRCRCSPAPSPTRRRPPRPRPTARSGLGPRYVGILCVGAVYWVGWLKCVVCVVGCGLSLSLLAHRNHEGSCTLWCTDCSVSAADSLLLVSTPHKVLPHVAERRYNVHPVASTSCCMGCCTVWFRCAVRRAVAVLGRVSWTTLLLDPPTSNWRFYEHCTVYMHITHTAMRPSASGSMFTL
jgi:hypothetical protein